MKNRQNIFLVLLFLVILFISSCDRINKLKQVYILSSDSILARVDGFYLLKDDFYNQYPYIKNSSDSLKKIYINQWVNEKLLYMYAKQLKLDKDPQVKKIIQQAQEEIIVNYLKKKIVGSKLEISEELLKRFYEKNKDRYRVKENEYKYIIYFFKDMKIAWKVKTNLIKQQPPKDIYKAARGVGVNILQKEQVTFFTKEHQIKSQILLAKLRVMNNGDYSRPFLYDSKPAIVYLIDKRLEGKYLPYEEVKSIVALDYIREREKEIIKDLIDSLRVVYDYEIFYK